MYTLTRTVELVVEILATNPRSPATDIAAAIGVERHTLQRRLKAAGTSLAKLRSECYEARISAALRSKRVLSRKELAYASGFSSPGALSQYTRRHPAICEQSSISCYFAPGRAKIALAIAGLKA